MPERKLKVFLSSTARDLTAFRKAVHARLAASPLFDCIRQEDFGARPHPAVATCQTDVQTSELFVGLIGMRRGWEPPDNPDQHSITEMEYDWAKDVAPRFMYVAPTNFPVPGDLRESEDEHQRQLGFRKRVMGGLVVSQDGFVSEDGLLTPDVLARLVVDQLTKHVLDSDLIDRIRPRRAPDLSNHLPDAIAERVVRLLDERGDIKKAERGGLARDIVLKLAKRITPDDTLDFDRAVTELENAVNIALDAIARGRRGGNEDDFVNDVLKTVAAHTQAGETERAVKTLDDALKELDSREAEQRATFKRSRVTLLEAGIAQDLLRRDAKAVAQRVARIAQIEHPKDSTARLAALSSRWQTFWDEGRDKGLNLYLEVGIEIARIELAAADTADSRGVALNDLGLALVELGYRESATERLEEAVTAYRDALKEFTRQSVPLQWAGTQNNLGEALRILGERERGTARLDEAVAAFRDALKEYTPDRASLDWAMAQNNLGIALLRLGERQSDPARLKEAVAAFHEALKEWTRERAPLRWARAQNSLGGALLRLGERESGTAGLDEAVGAYREALKEYTRERVPLDWAGAQANLGTALAALGARESGTARLEEAVAAYGEALEERTRERGPLQWASSTGNQGVALMQLADRRDDAGMAATAVSQIEQALMVSQEGGHIPLAQYFEARLPAARAIRDRLDKA